jgi:hypothetical protein
VLARDVRGFGGDIGDKSPGAPFDLVEANLSGESTIGIHIASPWGSRHLLVSASSTHFAQGAFLPWQSP